MRQHLLLVAALVLASSAVQPLGADTVKKSYSFELDKWYEIDAESGPVKLYRIRVERQSGAKTFKSILTRVHTDFATDVQIQIEYSNKSSKDWKGKMRIVWVDEKGETIDGYVGTESFGDETKHEVQTMLVSTLKYGLLRARKLEVEISVEKD